MKFDPFQVAVQKAKGIVGEDKWDTLDFASQSAVIYRQLRLIDADRASQPPVSESPIPDRPTSLNLHRQHTLTE